MKSFSSLLMENYIVEEKASSSDFGNIDKNSKGVLHELLVGYHLRGGNHMDKHADINGKSPREVHDELSSKLTKAQYKNFSDRSKKAADDILREHKMSPKDIANVQWTSKAGDIKRATGIESSQSEDDSDIIMTHKNGTHHGISLKVSDKADPITLSNNGAKGTFGGDKVFENHKKSILDNYPELNNLQNSDKIKKAAVQREIRKGAENGKTISPADVKVGAGDLRKAWLETTPGAKEDMKKRTTTMLRTVMNNMHNEVTKLPPQELADHIRNSVLHAYKTPKEELGHTHIRHFTGGGFDPKMESKRPGEDYEHFLAKPENLRATVSGANITYHYFHEGTGKNIPFAIQTAKVSSQSDPMSNLVVVGKDVERKQDEEIKKDIKQKHQESLGNVKPSIATKAIPPKAAPAAPIDEPEKLAAPVKGIRLKSPKPSPIRKPSEDIQGRSDDDGMGAAIGNRSHNPIEQSATSEHSGMPFHSPNEQEHIRGNV